MADRARGRPTLADVGRRSGVSAATVSYVLNDTRGQTISPATRERVLAAAAELGYVPSASAQALARGRSNVVIIDMRGIPLTEAVARGQRALAEALDARGFLPVVHQLSRPEEPFAALITLAQALRPTAVLAGTPLPENVTAQLERAGVDVVLSMLSSPDDVREMIAAGSRAQLDHLHAHGHRVVAHAPGGATAPADLAGFHRDATRRHAAALGMELHELPGSPDPDRLAAHLRTLQATRSLTAVTAYNDDVAAAVLVAAHELGWQVPDDLAVIGLTDAPIAALTWPALTTVRFSPGRTAPSPEEIVAAVLRRAVSLPAQDPWQAAVIERRSV